MGGLRTIAILTLASLLPGASGAAATSHGRRISGPYVHENLSTYLVHGAGTTTDEPLLTLDAALQAGTVTFGHGADGRLHGGGFRAAPLWRVGSCP